MPRDPTATRTRIYAAAYTLFYRKGFQRTSLDDVAAKAGVTKRTLYYHVRSKDDLAGAMLAHQHGFVLQEMARWIGDAADAHKLVDQLFDSVARWAAQAGKGRWIGSGFTRMAMELADLPGHPARVATRRHKSEVQAELARRLAACRVRRPYDVAAQLQMLLEGAMALILIHGDVRYARLAAAAARKLI
ncbi:TetR/AcrR family transcriptional regulator [Dongia deserti]|uniref:TetR/AcrR family transcriptional regulator n=1 Tax=Dongia deserti TaxID=2268030 RepID=UPI0013C4DD52|nr:TetR/AcrR family transcriptional regulator [Dongia deserti]